jgi:hypothetical protein
LVHSEIEIKVDSSSKGQKDFFVEKGKAAWGHAADQVGNWVL